MNSDCKQFRRRLRDALEGGLRGDAPGLEAVRPLSWHEHLFTCGQCRELLEAEEALEEVLASLPAPVLPMKLVKRILERLASERLATGRAPSASDLDRVLTTGDVVDVPKELTARVLAGIAYTRGDQDAEQLDVLLNLVPAPEVPAGLSARVLRRTRAERELALDALLNLVPAPRIPADLAGHVLGSLDAERSSAGEREMARPTLGALQYVAAIAATLVVAFGAWRLAAEEQAGPNFSGERDGLVREDGTGRDSVRDEPRENVATREANGTSVGGLIEIDAATPQPDQNASLLASLDVLEDWDLLMSADIDVLLGSLDEADAELLFLIEESDESSAAPEEG
ncbi:MAG: hypothetical protein OSB10_08300 [Planctomycetota bacterium]|nr:hypothetical protein [Planctomycetota bacterium]